VNVDLELGWSGGIKGGGRKTRRTEKEHGKTYIETAEKKVKTIGRGGAANRPQLGRKADQRQGKTDTRACKIRLLNQGQKTTDSNPKDAKNRGWGSFWHNGKIKKTKPKRFRVKSGHRNQTVLRTPAHRKNRKVSRETEMIEDTASVTKDRTISY